ncbi:hypothetical protein FA13DRAFT_1774538 [Coprinellus micaceus]|uniref:DUF6533 domain-containing protein n=1 Tax=Coprinellus micaceus TaxID=71717 RepID=A0A4Y7TB17_COPMI|nr:hypothetical protein FA13DRAFT_1774538 [Coprinellus micaceus]
MTVAPFIQPTILQSIGHAARLLNGSTHGLAPKSVLVDYIHTLPEEIRLIWPTRLSTPKVIFLIVRYGNIAFALAQYLYTLGFMFSEKGCRHLLAVIAIVQVVLIILGEGIMYVRVLAFSGRDRRVLGSLVFAYVTTTVTSVGCIVPWVNSSFVAAGVVPGTACALLHDTHLYVNAVHALLLLSNTYLVAMLMAIGFRRHRITGPSIRERGGGVLYQFYRAGLWYFLVVLGLNIANILVDVLNVHLHGMLVTRIVLQLRRYAEKNQTVVLGSSNMSAEDESAMAGFATWDRQEHVLDPIDVGGRQDSGCNSDRPHRRDPEDSLYGGVSMSVHIGLYMRGKGSTP